jgi:lamin tail-like protein/EGF domain-containing protein
LLEICLLLQPSNFSTPLIAGEIKLKKIITLAICFALCTPWLTGCASSGGDPCESANCDELATCADVSGTAVCTCPEGYNDTNGDGSACADIDECTAGSDDCDSNATCANTAGSFTCTCNTGYDGDGTACADINECTAGGHNCDSNATCTNSVGSFSCACNSGFTGDGTACTDIDECTDNTDNCDVNATCDNTPGSFTCTCNGGWSGDGTTCVNTDECTDGTHSCDENALCEDTVGSFTCTCNSGYTGDGFDCTDIDECDLGTAGCHADATCDNIGGSFTCTCNSGYDGDGFACTNIDECDTGTDNCDDNALCEDTLGDYTCTCNAGYDGDGFTCTNIDECDLGSDLCDDNALCEDTTPDYTCTCNSGYDGDGFNCTNIDECYEGTDLCDDNALCEDTDGNYTCTCNSGYDGDGFTCTDIDECATGDHDCNSDDQCHNTQGGFYCSLLESFLPPLSYIRAGDIGTTFPDPLTVRLAQIVAVPTTVTLSSSSPSLVVDDIFIPAGTLSDEVTVDASAASGGLYTVTANLDGDVLTADVFVLQSGYVPQLIDLQPATAVLSIAGQLEMTVVLDLPAPPGGIVVDLSASCGSVPASITVIEDQLQATFDFTAGDVAASCDVIATLGSDTFSSTIDVIEGIPVTLVINEIDYDQPSGDTEEFVELYNASANPFDLTGLTVITFNGNGDEEVARYDLSGTLEPGAFFLLANAGVNIPIGVASIQLPSNALQNGSPDGIAIFDTVNEVIIDALCYEGEMTAVTIDNVAGTFSLLEGEATPIVDNGNMSLIRLPDGTDTNNAADDWSESSTPTPGLPNQL